MANEVTGIAWVLMVRQEVYQKPQLATDNTAQEAPGKRRN